MRAVYCSHQNPRLSALAKLSTWKGAILPQPRLIEVDFAFKQLYQLHTLSKNHYDILTRFVTLKLTGQSGNDGNKKAHSFPRKNGQLRLEI